MLSAMNQLSITDRTLNWLKRLGVSRIGAAELNLVAYLLVVNGWNESPWLHGDVPPGYHGALISIWFLLGVMLGLVGVGWSVINTLVDIFRLASETRFRLRVFLFPAESRPPQDGRHDAIAMLAVSAWGAQTRSGHQAGRGVGGRCW
jgi:hypothetical protein